MMIRFVARPQLYGYILVSHFYHAKLIFYFGWCLFDEDGYAKVDSPIINTNRLPNIL